MNVIKAAIVSKDNQKATFIASNQKADRHGDTIDPKGWQLKNFKKNPVILFAHDQRSLPVGTATSIKIENDDLVVDVDFSQASKLDEFAAKVAGFVKAGILNAVSVGFSALDYEPRYEKGEFVGFHFLKTELNEISIVPVPANPSALAIAKNLHVDDNQLNRLLITSDQNTNDTNLHRQKLKLMNIRARIT